MIRLKKIDSVLLAVFALTFIAGVAVHFMPERELYHRPGRVRPAAESVARAPTREKRSISSLEIDEKRLQEKLKKHPALARRFALFTIASLLIILASLACAVRMALRLWKGQPAVVQLGSPPRSAWTLGDILRLILLILVAGQTILLLEWIAFKRFNPAWFDENILSLGNTVLMDLVAAAYAFLLLKRASRQAEPAEPGAAIRLGIASYLIFLPFFFLMTSVAYSILQALGMNPEPQSAVMMFLSETRPPVVWWLTALATIGGPVAEELFFRGMLYGYLRTRFGIGLGLVLSAVLFAALHANLMAFLPVLGLGLLFGWVYEKTGTLAAPIAVHMLHNAGMLAVASLMKQLIS